MPADFINVIKSFMRENGLRDLSSEGWKRMREVKRQLDAKEITKDDAIGSFLQERDFRMEIDRHDIEDLKKMLR